MGFRLPPFLPHPLIYMLLETNDRARKGGQIEDNPGNWNDLFEPGVYKINPPLEKKEKKQWFVGAVIRSEEAR